eukprot:PhM_4_TR6849/c0_g1_i1/m.52537
MDDETQILHGFLLIHHAAAADADGDTDTSLALYAKALHGLQLTLSHISDPQQRQLLLMKITSIEERIAATTTTTPTTTTINGLEETERERKDEEEVCVVTPRQRPVLELHEQRFKQVTMICAASSSSASLSSSTSDEVAPSSTMRRPFWFLRRVRESIVCGATFSPSLHIPKDVWSPVGGKLTHTVPNIQGKSAYFSAMSKLLTALQMEVRFSHFSSDASDKARVVARLESFIRDANILHRTCLSSSDACTSKTQDGSKHTSSSAHSRSTSVEKDDALFSAQYLPHLMALLEDVQFIDGWLVQLQYDGFAGVGPEVLEQLHRVSVVIFLGPLCVVYKDMFALVHRYMSYWRDVILT